MKLFGLCNCAAILALCLSFSAVAAEKTYLLASPDGGIEVKVTVGDVIRYDVSCNGKLLFAGNRVQLQLQNETLGLNPRLAGQQTASNDTEIRPPVPFRQSVIQNRYNQLTLRFRGGWSLEFRAFDDGMAYRFVTARKGETEVMNEVIDFNFDGDYLLHTQFPGRRGFESVYEDSYSHVESREWKPADDMSTLPLLVDTRKGVKVLISEADLIDYPCFFLRGKGADNGMTAVFPPAPLELKPDDNKRNVRVSRAAPYIAKTSAARSFPWRYLVIADNDGKLLETTMVARLVPHAPAAAFDWVKPGLVMWDWINRWADFGPEVTYTAGVNTDAYKHYIDFASRNRLPYLILDEGWSVDNAYPQAVKPEVDLRELVRYGNEKNVGLILWITYRGIYEDFLDDSYNLFEHFSQMGIKGFKIDFMDRSDQDIVNFYEQAAAESARHRMLVELHGSYKPAGMEYRYPHVLSYEGVRGMENGGRCLPDNSVYLPFMRGVAGPMSFTPGSMLNVQPDSYQTGLRNNVVMIGTRVHHMAYYILFESGLQMISDSPRQFDMNPDCRDFIFATPVTWDETRALAAEAGQYAIAARRNGHRWWLGGIANNAEQQREFDLALDFLPEGKTFRMTSFEDGPNAGRQAMDYTVRTREVKRGDRIHVRLVRNGGLAAVIE
jgi:alpha-glucosidase